jgi:hypothetical protein
VETSGHLVKFSLNGSEDKFLIVGKRSFTFQMDKNWKVCFGVWGIIGVGILGFYLYKNRQSISYHKKT